MCTLLSQMLDKIQKYQHLWHEYLRDCIHVERIGFNGIAPYRNYTVSVVY
jgi:hypothetical protein